MLIIYFIMKKIKIYGVFISFFFAILLHFIYKLIPTHFISVIAPVNESIWEHMKLIVTSSLLFGVLECYIYKKRDITFNNLILSYGIASILAIIVYLIIYIPLYDIFGHKVYMAVGLLFLIFILLQIISYYIISYKKINYAGSIGIFLIIIIYFIFGFFIYFPPVC